MSTLRARLESAAPELHEALERSWKIAFEEWLPAIGHKGGSYNSYPHLRNIEQHLDQVVASCEQLPLARGRINLSPAELYVLLASVLFHDIGRLKPGGGHATSSRHVIEREYPSLGIPSSELAGCIGKVCEAHDPPNEWDESELCDVVIDPHGEVRERQMAALLVLGDHMDSAYNRVIPQYVDFKEGSDVVGEFRKVVRGVVADPAAQMIRLVIASAGKTAEGKKGENKRGTVQKAGHHYVPEKQHNIPLETWDLNGDAVFATFTRFIETVQPPTLAGSWDQVPPKILEYLIQSLLGSAKEREGLRALWNVVLLNDSPASKHGAKEKNEANAHVQEPTQPKEYLVSKVVEHTLKQTGKKDSQSASPGAASLPTAVPPDPRSQQVREALARLGMLDRLVVAGLLKVEQAQKNQGIDCVWPSGTLLAVIMGDTRKNTNAVRRVQDDLAVIGVPIRAWLIENSEHLYNWQGYETYEPILDPDFLMRILDGMWDLSVGVFACARFTYEELAAQVREPDVSKVRRAVRRIAIVARTTPHAKGTVCRPLIWAGDSCWRWNRAKCDSTKNGDAQKLVTASDAEKKQLIRLVAVLQPPNPPLFPKKLR